MIFRLISSQLGSPSPDYDSHIIMSISGISLHINPHIISLLPVLSKVLEKVVHNKLSRYLQFNEILYESQYGFRKHHSTVHGVAEFMHHNVKAYDDKKTHCRCSA